MVRQVIDNLLEVGLPIVMSRLRVSRTSRSSKSTANVDAAALNQVCGRVARMTSPYWRTDKCVVLPGVCGGAARAIRGHIR